ncbi:MAG: DNA polymerase III subunit tau [Chlamydiae bacterium]|nr:DNA polymerase III subunit tau [Chlamydiota bacterium]
MEKYQIIPRRFRPKSFSEVAGHEPIVTTLKNALALNRVSQAYLFCGSRGTGKTTLARLFAKALNCTARKEDGEPCNSCRSCDSINEGRSLDIIEIDGASNRGIDDIRQINETVGYASAEGGKKIYIIDEVHMLTKEAFNALLKTLEEPPQNVVFFFATTEPHKVLPTILSRCQRFDLQRLPLKPIRAKLSTICNALELSYEDEALELIATLSDGSLRDAENLLDKLICSGLSPLTAPAAREILGLQPTAFFFSLDEAIGASALKQALTLGNELFDRGTDLTTALNALLDHFRNHLVLLLDGTLAHPEKALYQKHNAQYTKDQCLYILDLLIQWQQSGNSSFLSRAHFEILMTQLIRSRQTTTIDQLVLSLQELEKKIGGAPEPVRKEEEPPPPPKKEEAKKASPPPPQKEELHSSRHDTIMRFAAVELEGTIVNKRS